MYTDRIECCLFQCEYKEASGYLAKFHQCLSRALSLIKTHVFTILQNATKQVMPQKVRLDGDKIILFLTKNISQGLVYNIDKKYSYFKMPNISGW